MRDILRNIKEVFFNHKLNKEKYERVEEEIQKRNSDFLIMTSFIAFFVFIALTILSFILNVPTLTENRNLYIVLAIIIFIMIIISNTVAKKHPKIILFLCYISLFILFCYGIVLGTYIQADANSVTFCVLLFLLPLVFIDKTYRMNILLTLVTLIFCICAYIFKEEKLAHIDIGNALSFFFVSLTISSTLTNAKINDIIAKETFEKERDVDSLTTLYNKEATIKKITKYLDNKNTGGALVMLDIDDFKGLNDTCGHYCGDTILKILGQNIKETFTNQDILGRFGGDEFVLFIKNINSKKEIEEKIIELFEKNNKTMINPKTKKSINISVGIIISSSCNTYEELFKEADKALYDVKNHGKNNYKIIYK